MKNLWSYVSNENYSVGCSEQAVYLFDTQNKEIAKFKDIKHGYLPILSPVNDIFVVKGTAGMLAIYSAKDKCLVKKIQFSQVTGSQDDGGCFSSDGTLFYNIERFPVSSRTRLTIYNTSDWSVQCHLFENDEQKELSAIEIDDCDVYVLGFSRDEEHVACSWFCAKLKDEQLTDNYIISKQVYDVHLAYYKLMQKGFTEKSFKWSYWQYNEPDTTLSDVQSMELSLKKLWMESAK